MSKLWDILTGRMKQQDATVPARPFIHEAIDVKNYPLSELDYWRSNTSMPSDTSEIIHTAYQYHTTTGADKNNQVSILSSPSSNGWVMFCQQQDFNKKDYLHYIHMLYLRLKDIGYILNLADEQSKQKPNWLEHNYRYYMKPSLRLMNITKNKKANQLYGNISMELISRNGKPYVLKFLANTYSDQHYAKPGDFGELLDHLLVP